MQSLWKSWQLTMDRNYRKVSWHNKFKDGSFEQYCCDQSNLFSVADNLNSGPEDRQKFKVRCALCDTAIFKCIAVESWSDWLTAREQKHFDSEQHRENLLFWKLGNQDGEEI